MRIAVRLLAVVFLICALAPSESRAGIVSGRTARTAPVLGTSAPPRMAPVSAVEKSAEFVSTPLIGDFLDLKLPAEEPSTQGKATSVDSKGRMHLGSASSLKSLGLKPLSSKDLVWHRVDPHTRVSYLRVRAPGAEALRLGLRLTNGAQGIQLRFRDSAGLAQAADPVELNAVPGAVRWSPRVQGESMEVEISASNDVNVAQEVFLIDAVSRSRRLAPKALGASASCQRDVACFPLSDNAKNNASSVAIVDYISTNGQEYGCTGTLLNSNPSTFIPYVMTSSDCISTPQEAASVTTYWNYAATSCGSGVAGSFSQVSGGATLLASDSSQHFALLRLNGSVPGGVYYSGWSAETLGVGTAVTVLHHPQVDLKKLNVGQVDSGGSSLQVHFSSGLMEPGSQGAGLFTDDQYWSGIVTGWDSVSCSNAATAQARFAPLAAFWDKLQPYLAPTQSASNYSDIWWNPSESGWGITIADHETQLFAVWYTYRDDGSPIWYVIPGGTFSQGRQIFDGDIYATSGPPYTSATFDTGRVTTTKVGTAHFDFAPAGLPANTATFTYSLGGTGQTKQIQRQPFGNASPSWKSDFTDIWWNPLESGWGVTLAQHGNNVFGVFFLYGTNGQPLWVVMPGVTFKGSDTFEGQAYTTVGPPLSAQPFDPSRVRTTAVGTVKATFHGDSAVIGYTINGAAASKGVIRQAFGNSSPPACDAAGRICIAGMSSSTVTALDRITLVGSGFDPIGSGLTVRFSPQNGDLPVEVPAAVATPTSIEVVVPQFVSAGAPTSRTVNVQVIESSSTHIATSNVLSSVAVNAPPSPGNATAGAMTAAWLNVGLNVATSMQSAAASTPNSGHLQSALQSYITELQVASAAVNSVVNKPSQTAVLKNADGSTTEIDAATLRLADQAAQAVVTNLGNIVMTSGAKADCPVSPGDPTAYDSWMCQLQRMGQNFSGQNAQFNSMLNEHALSFMLEAMVPEESLATKLIAAPLIPLVSSWTFQHEMPEGSEIAFNLLRTPVPDPETNLLAVVKSGVELVQAAATMYPPSPIILSHSLVYGDGAGNSYLITSDGTALIRVPSSPGSFDSTQLVVPPSPSACSYTYSAWSACTPAGTQSRSVVSSSPAGCVGTPQLTQACVYTPPSCIYTYSNWGACQPNNTQSRSVLSSTPAGCVGTPLLSESCTYQPSMSSFKWTVGDKCNDGETLYFRLFDRVNRIQWPTDTSMAYYLTFGQTSSVTISCITGSSVCLGAQNTDGSDTWGVNLNGTGSADGTVCQTCTNTSYSLDLTCGQPGPGPGGSGQCNAIPDGPHACQPCNSDSQCDPGQGCWTSSSHAPFCP